MVKIQSKISTCGSLLEVNTVKPDNSVNFTTTIVDIVNGHPKVASVTISDMLSAVSEDMLTSLEKENVRTAVKTSDTIAEVLINSELYKVLAGVGVITLKNHNVSGVLELTEVLELIAAKKNSDLLFVPIKDDTFLVDTIGAIWRYGLNPNKYTISYIYRCFN